MLALCCAFIIVMFGAVVLPFYPIVGTWICIFGMCVGAVGLCKQAGEDDAMVEQSVSEPPQPVMP